MHANLSHRITQLICDADSMSPASLKSELLDLAQHCQVVPGNRFLVRAVCRSLEGPASAVFGPLALLLVMTEPRRRQVYFAVLARLEADGAFVDQGLDEAARADLLSRLVLSRNEDIIAQTYGSCPAGFLPMISRFGECGRRSQIYTGLFQLLEAHEELAKPLLAACQSGPPSDDLIELAQALPPTPTGVQVAARFDSARDYEQLMRPYEAITGAAELSEAHLQRIARGESPDKLLERLYLDLPFPPPALTSPELEHIANGHALVRAAREFSNCLGSFVAEALKGERQFYIWRRADDADVVVSIGNEPPFGWYLSEAKLARNAGLPRQLRKELKSFLNTLGVRAEGSVEKLISPYREDPDLLLIDDVFDLDDAA
mgnify:CR=1 FL=1